MNNIHLAAIACRPYGQTDCPGGFADTLTVIQVNQAQALVLDNTFSTLGIINSPYSLILLMSLKGIIQDRPLCQWFIHASLPGRFQTILSCLAILKT